jgi:hypothetical protein
LSEIIKTKSILSTETRQMYYYQALKMFTAVLQMLDWSFSLIFKNVLHDCLKAATCNLFL